MSNLQQLIENSKANEAIAQKLFEIETEILACQSSDELLQRLLGLIQVKFNLSGIALLLVEPTPLNYLLNGNLQSVWHKNNTRSVPFDKLAAIQAHKNPILCNQLEDIKDVIPEALLVGVQSIALTPLTLEGKFFGNLLFTDKDPARFHQKLGTFHLEQLAVKVSLCLSNVMIREQLEYMAHYDRLTGVANRRLMEVSISEELVRQRRYGVPFSVLFIDCNKFKAINDTYGHDCGDKVLAYVATSLQELVRENDKCFRYAGDEFVIVLASQTQLEAEQASERLCRFFLTNPMPYQGQHLAITISCGVAASNGQQSMDELLKIADQDLYKKKKVNPTMVFKL